MISKFKKLSSTTLLMILCLIAISCSKDLPDSIIENENSFEQHSNYGALNAKYNKNYDGPTSGVEIENPAKYKIWLERSLDQGVIAEIMVESTGEIIADISTDIGKQNVYTIENRTTPVVVTDVKGLNLRKEALKLAKEAIEDAVNEIHSQAIRPVSKNGLKLKVIKAKHSIKEDRNTGRPGVQVTLGASWSEMINDAPRLVGVLKDARGRWMDQYKTYSESFKNKYPKSGRGAVEVYGMLASLLHYYMIRIDNSNKKIAIQNKLDYDTMGSPGIGGKGVDNDELVRRPNIVDAKEKNAWGLLPKTPPGKWLEGLKDEQDISNIKTELRNIPPGINKTAWKEINTELLKGNMIAGHKVPEFTIKGEVAFAFEIRTPSSVDRQPYGL
ncbi:hypothetical protein [Tenacibaculum sp. C7A-26P2]|uniref:hypothetical protein n=1 Tax=Tenacibaculum sp. C7A-26P2 TaxID=3447504 RepID=UPI003F833FE6